MKKNLLALILMGAFVAPAMAEKLEWAGKAKPTSEQKAAHQAAMESNKDMHNDEAVKERKDKSQKLKRVEKQQSKKSEQIRKELDKGSDKGKESRATNSKKWWKFWGE